MSIKNNCTRLCALSKRYSNSKSAYNPSNGEGVVVVQTMEDLAKELRVALKLSEIGGLSILISKGQGTVPKVFWVAIVQSGRSPANSLSVTICFGRRGEGLVAGLMVPKTASMHLVETVHRRDSALKVDVDGDKVNSKYNNCFVNPKEWLAHEIDEAQLTAHLANSIGKLNDLSKDVSNYRAYFGN